MLDGLFGFDTRYCLQYLFLPCTDAHDNILALPMLSLLSIYRSQSYRDRSLANTLCVPLSTAPAGRISTYYRDYLSIKQGKYYLGANYNTLALPSMSLSDQFFNSRTLELSFRKQPPWPRHEDSEFSLETVYPALSRQPFRFVADINVTAPVASNVDVFPDDNPWAHSWTSHAFQSSELHSHSLIFILNITGKRILLVLGTWSGGEAPRSLACHTAILGAKELLRPTLTDLTSLSTKFSSRENLPTPIVFLHVPIVPQG